jgi:hypothetical protein
MPSYVWSPPIPTCTQPSTSLPTRSPGSCASSRRAWSSASTAPRGLPPQPLTTTDYADLIDEKPGDEDELVREKVIDLPPMTEEQALVQTDLIGHDFYVFTNAETGLVNVIYHRHNGGYGIIKPKIEESDE